MKCYDIEEQLIKEIEKHLPEIAKFLREQRGG